MPFRTDPPPPLPPHGRVCIHDEMQQRCMGKARIQWTNAYIRWWLSGGTSRQERRPSLKLSLQGPNTVCGVDGQPVLLIRRSSGISLTPAERQLSFNCPRYISVGVSLKVCVALLSLPTRRSIGCGLLSEWRCVMSPASACISQANSLTMVNTSAARALENLHLADTAPVGLA